MYGRVEVLEHAITAPPLHKSDYVGVDYFQDKYHGTSCLHRARTDLGWFEPDLWDRNIEGLPERLGKIYASGSITFTVSGYF